MTKYELQQKRDRLQKELKEVTVQLEKMNKVLSLDNNEKPFSKYTLGETNDLFDISEKAYIWLVENKDKNIYDYNATVPTANRIVLEK